MFISYSHFEIMQLKIVFFIAICVVGLSLGEYLERRDQDRRYGQQHKKFGIRMPDIFVLSTADGQKSNLIFSSLKKI